VATDDAVFAGVETRLALEYANANLLLSGFFWRSKERACGDMGEKVAEPSGGCKLPTLHDAPYQLPALVTNQFLRVRITGYLHAEITAPDLFDVKFHRQITLN
jgi:hypothetical protein